MLRRPSVLGVVVVALLAFVYGSAVVVAPGARASVRPHLVALARALAAHPLPASALPTGFRNVGCGLRDHAIPCPTHISPYADNVNVIYYMLLKRKPGPQDVTLIYRIYDTRSAARRVFHHKQNGTTGGTCGRQGDSSRTPPFSSTSSRCSPCLRLPLTTAAISPTPAGRHEPRRSSAT
jgi:hypothetical protein